MSLYYSDISKRKHNTWCNYTLRLDTYGCGCQHNCTYCYAKSLLSFRGLWDSVNPRPSELWRIKKVLDKLPKSRVVKLGGMSDCFMPIEKIHRVTYNTIKMLNYYKIHYLIVTKNSLVASDEYIAIYDKNLAHFQISITSTDRQISQKHETASAPKERILAIEKLYKAGFDVSVRLSPFIPEFIDLSIINNISCNKILIEFLKVTHWVKKWFNIGYLPYTCKHGGYEHMELTEKIQWVDKITGFDQKSVGEYVSDHHKYFSTQVNYNKNDCCNLDVQLKNTSIPAQKTINFE
jgi:DNA repair photolyase